MRFGTRTKPLQHEQHVCNQNKTPKQRETSESFNTWCLVVACLFVLGCQILERQLAVNEMNLQLVLQWVSAPTASRIWSSRLKNRCKNLETRETFFLPVSLCRSVLFRFQSQTCLFLVQSPVPTHHWYSPLKANSSRKRLGPLKNGLLTEYPSFQEAASWLRKTPCHWLLRAPLTGFTTSPRLFVMPAVGAIINLIYSACCCEHTHLWADCKTDSCKGSISFWWFYLSVFLHAKNKCCKKCEMRSHFPHGSIICYMPWHDIVSLLYVSRLILAMSRYRNTNCIFCFIASVSHFQPQTYFQYFFICLVSSFVIKYSSCCMRRYLCMSSGEPSKQALKDQTKTGFFIQVPFADILVY